GGGGHGGGEGGLRLGWRGRGVAEHGGERGGRNQGHCPWAHGFSPMEGARERRGRRSRVETKLLVQRLELDDVGAVVAAYPERHRGRRVVDEDAADVGRLRQQVLDKGP